jgi:hypothetical protein
VGPVHWDEFGQQIGVTGTGRGRSRWAQGKSSAGGATGINSAVAGGAGPSGAGEEDHIEINRGSAGRVGRPGLCKR